MDEVVTKADEITTADSEGDGVDDSAETSVVENLKDKEYEQEDEVDDETTMEEEEALPEIEDPLREIRFLREESDMPIHELMLMYNYPNNTSAETSTKIQKKNKMQCLPKKSKDKKKKIKVSTSSDGIAEKKVKPTEKQKLDDDSVEEENTNEGNSSSCKISEESPTENENIEAAENGDDSSELLGLYMADIDQVQSEDEDEDYKPHWELHWKSVNVGVNFQALVTDGLSTYGDVLPYENNDELLWDPNVLSEDLIEDYLIKIQQITKALKPKSKTIGVRDNEKALYLLVQCGHDVAEAIRRMSLNAIPMEKSLSVWSEEETTKFEHALLNKGKNFHAIQKEVKTRSVAELVHFYYFWKKTERHDEFEKKRQSTMRTKIKKWQQWESDEDQDSDFDNMYHEDSEDSLNAAENKAQMKCLIYADRKRQVRKKATNNACSNTSTNTN